MGAASGGSWLARRWRADRPALAVTTIGLATAAVAWGGTTRPMADTVSYRGAAEVLRAGWPSLTDRTPGYPLLLLITGSIDDGPHRLLFVVQLAMHLATILLVVDLAARAGIGRRGRTVLAALLVTPPVLLRVLYEGTEGLAALLLTAVAWLLVTPWPPGRTTRRAVCIGVLCGAAALVRPTFALLFVPVGLLALGPWKQAGGRADRAGRAGALAAVALPALILAGGWSTLNGVRFDSPGLTPLTPYHLSSRTSPFVELLPESYEPARSVLIRARDQALLRGESSAPGNFIWSARDELARATGLEGTALDRYVLEMDLQLIANNPLNYIDTVKTATVNYSGMDSQPAVQGLGRTITWLQQGLHLILLAVTLGLWSLLPGLGLAGLIDRGRARLVVVGLVISAYCGVVSVLTETGTARLRAPTEPLLALSVVVAASITHPYLTRIRARWLTQRGEFRDAGRNT